MFNLYVTYIHTSADGMVGMEVGEYGAMGLYTHVFPTAGGSVY